MKYSPSKLYLSFEVKGLIYLLISVEYNCKITQKQH